MQSTLDQEQKIEILDERVFGGRYLSFAMCGGEFGIEILKVREIMGFINVTPVPQTPGYIKGVINLRGKVIPVIDLRLKFGLQQANYTKETCIIVVDMKNMLTGIIVDSVSEVMAVGKEDFESMPYFRNGVDTKYFLGMAKIKDKVKILLDIDRVFHSADIAMVEELFKQKASGL